MKSGKWNNKGKYMVQNGPKVGERVAATVYWESLSSFYWKLSLFDLFQKKKKKKGCWLVV